MSPILESSGEVTLAEGLAMIEKQHAKYREIFQAGIREHAQTKVNSIIQTPNGNASVFHSPNAIKITFSVPIDEFQRIFGINEEDSGAIHRFINHQEEITRLVQNALTQEGYSVQVNFWEGWPHGKNTGFTVTLEKPLGEEN